MQRILSLLLGSVALMSLAACEKEEPPVKETPLRVNAAIAAVVNGEYILASEVELEAAAQGLMEPGDTLEIEDPVFQQILDQLIDQKLLAQEAMNLGLDQEESSRHRLQAARERILGNLLVENLVAQQVDEAAIMEMYNAQTELQQLGEEVLVRQILVSSQEEAQGLYQQLQDGAEFAALAFNHSLDRVTSAEGGLIGYVLPEAMSEPYRSVISRTSVGRVSQPFETQVGWVIVKVEDRRQEEPPTLDETRPKIVQFLTLSEISKVLKRLRTRAEIQTITGEDTISAFEDETLEGLPEADPEDGEPADTEDNETETGESPATETEEPTE